MKNPYKGGAPEFTPEERVHVTSLLLYAKTILARKRQGKEQGQPALICAAIKRMCSLSQPLYDVEPKLQALIKYRLGGAPTLRAWLIDRGYPAAANDDATFEKVQQTRIAWIDALVEEFKPTQENRNEQTASRAQVRDPQRQNRPPVRRYSVPAVPRRDYRFYWTED